MSTAPRAGQRSERTRQRQKDSLTPSAEIRPDYYRDKGVYIAREARCRAARNEMDHASSLGLQALTIGAGNQVSANPHRTRDPGPGRLARPRVRRHHALP